MVRATLGGAETFGTGILVGFRSDRLYIATALASSSASAGGRVTGLAPATHGPATRAARVTQSASAGTGL